MPSKRKKKNKLKQARLKELLHYDPDTGLFTWKVSRQGVTHSKVAGSVTQGVKDENGKYQYRVICVDHTRYRAHRLAFLYMEGYFPEHGVDHKNGIPDDNSWDNLRHSTQKCNLQNTGMNSNNTSNFPGVYYFKEGKKWCAYIRINRKKIHLGLFKHRLNAALARLTAEINHPEWTCNYRSELIKAIKRVWPEFPLTEIYNGRKREESREEADQAAKEKSHQA